jgi:hypothetical protein
MPGTTKIPQDQLADYFEGFTRRFLKKGGSDSIDVEVIEPELGDQRPVEGVRLQGVTYERETNTLEFELDSGDHRVYGPEEVWTVEDENGFVTAIEVVKSDASKEIISIRRADSRPDNG